MRGEVVACEGRRRGAVTRPSEDAPLDPTCDWGTMLAGIELTAASKLPQLFSYTVQRVAAVGTTEALRALTDRLGRTEDPVQRQELAAGIVTLVGKKQ